MSKSLGNFFILRDILAKYPHDVVRYYLIATHYRSPLDFDDGKLEEARKALGRLKTTLNLAEEFMDDIKSINIESEQPSDLMPGVLEMQDKFIEAMDDDFNTAKALGYLFEMSHIINSFVASGNPHSQPTRETLQKAVQIFKQLGGILGIFLERNEDLGQAVDALLTILLKMRTEARLEKNYALADSLRDLLNRLAVKVEDKPTGSLFRYDKPPAVDAMMDYLINLRQDFKASKEYSRADMLRDSLQQIGIMLEDTREGARWKFADA